LIREGERSMEFLLVGKKEIISLVDREALKGKSCDFKKELKVG
jgi:hypothetical protein